MAEDYRPDGGASLLDCRVVFAPIEPAVVEALDRELKYLLPWSSAPAVKVLLDGVCRPEIPHAHGVVDTIYFDTPDRRSWAQKDASELHKVKVRVRWYDGTGEVFAEVKRRQGWRRAKHRAALPLAAGELSRLGLQAPALRQVPALLAASGEPVAAVLRPVLRLRYRRCRYVEPTSGTRVALDTGIATVETAAPLAAPDPRPLPWAVLELKGAVREMPRALAALPLLGCRRAAVSKYAACLARAAAA